MGKQIVVHSIDHASYAPQLISVVPKPTYSCSETYREGIPWMESVATSKLLVQSQSLPHQGEIYSITILGQYPFCLLGGLLINVIELTLCTLVYTVQ